MRTDSAEPIRLADYAPPDYLIDTVDLDVSLAQNDTHVRALLSIRPNPAGRPGAPLVLDGDELTCIAVKLNRAPVDPESVATPSSLTIAAPPQEPFTLEVETKLDPVANTKLMGLYRSGSAYCTQCEADGFRRITYFLDRPDVLSVYTTRIEADAQEAPVLLGNGNPVAHGPVMGTKRHFAVWHDPHPKPSYLFALVGGDLGVVRDTFTTMSGREVELGIYVEPGKESRATYAMDALKRSMRWDERVYGCEYDLDVFNIVAVSDFNMGAMENKGLNIFNDKYVLALPETATDADYAAIEAIIAHEYFHNWTGNRITCRDWFQLCLKEGLTVFRDQEFSSDERSRAVKRIADVRTLRAQQFTEDAGPLAHNVRPETYREINNFYTPTVYEKGAEVIRMLKLIIGDSAFERGMRLYLERCDGIAATVEDFIACFAESSGRDLTQFMRWYQQAGTPLLTVRTHHDSAAQTYRIDLEQTIPPTPGQSEKKPAVIPVKLGLIDAAGGEVALQGTNVAPHEAQGGVIEFSEKTRSVTFSGIAKRPVLSILRGFSAPVRLDSDQTEADLLVLLAHDSDPFNRWQAAQTYATRLLIRSAAALRAGGKAQTDGAFVEALGAVLAASGDHDPAFVAQVLAMPSESDIAREIGRDVDPDSIFAARRALRESIGKGLAGELRRTDEKSPFDLPYAPDSASAGRRALRNIALDLIAAGDATEGAQRAEFQFQRANNMTDRLAALAVLSHVPGEAREEALQSFLRAHASDPLVIDKWLAVQATIPERGTLDRVQGLMQHHAFSMSNPNRVRALVASFAAGNPTQFNRADGKGYAFLAEIVLHVDKANPQLAARLLTAFRTWRALEPQRAALAEQALRRVAGSNSLSKDVEDIVTRSLA